MHYLIRVRCSHGAEEMFVILSAYRLGTECHTQCDVLVSVPMSDPTPLINKKKELHMAMQQQNPQ